jgi:hypothetical protein
MQPELSVHDNFIYGYRVDCEGRRLILNTVFRDREPIEYTDVIFHEVLAHHFEHVLQSNILFDVEEIDVANFVQENAELFARSWQHGWPPLEYSGDLVQLINSIRAASVRAFAVSSSYGLAGWVLARTSQRVARGSPASFAEPADAVDGAALGS